MTTYTVQGHLPRDRGWDTIKTEDPQEAVEHAKHTCEPIAVYIDGIEVMTDRTTAQAVDAIREWSA